MIDKNTLLCCINLTKYYQYSNVLVRVLNGINLNVQQKDIVSIIGPSGSGKSTLLHLLGGLECPTTGDVFFQGKELNTLSDSKQSKIRNKDLGFVYQSYHLLSDFNVLENVMIPLLIGGVGFKIAKKKAECILTLVGLNKRLCYFPQELSGGESQRVALARAIVNNPKLILADEPTGNLDYYNTNNIFQLFRILNADYGTTFIIATHDLSLAKRCDKTYTMSNGVLVTNNL